MQKPNYDKKVDENNTTSNEANENEKPSIDFNNLSSEIVSEINKARTNPQEYIKTLETDKSYFKENILYRPDLDPLRTHEGESAHDEAIEFLSNLEPLNQLGFHSELAKACYDHTKDIGDKGLYTNEGSNRENISQRVEQYAEWDYVLCLNMDFGGRTAQEVVISFLTGDGDKNRTHRKNMFRADIKFIGTASNEHKEADVCTAVVYAGNVRELNSVAPEVKNFLENHMKKVEEEKKNPKPKKIKTKFQIEDPDAPDNAISYVTFKKIKLVEGRAKNCTQRVYTLSDGSQHIVEIFDDLKTRLCFGKKEKEDDKEILVNKVNHNEN